MGPRGAKWCYYVLCAVLFLHTAGAQQTPSIWESPTLPQPFDRTAFSPIRLPDWVLGTVGVGYTLSGQNFQQRERAAKAGVTISELNFVDPFYPYYDSRLLQKRSPHVAPGRLEKDIAEYRQLGIRVLAVYPPALQSEVYEKHPDWRRVPTDTNEVPQVDMAKHPYGGGLCLLGPYGEFFIEVLAEIATIHPDVSAFSFDGLHHGGVCYCQHCREAYRAETGAEIPKVNMEDSAFRHYQHWADRRLEDLVRRMQSRLKSIRPDIALVTWSTNAGRFGHLRDIPRNMPARLNLLFDAPDQEFWLDESNRGASIVPAFANAYAWAVSNHRVAFSEPYLMSHGNPYGKDSFPEHEILRRMLLAVTHGAGPSIAVGQPRHMQEGVYRCLEEVQKRKQWLTHKTPEPWAAVLVSDNTRNFYGRTPGKVEERYLASVFGFFRAALEEHLPFTLINDWNLTENELSRFKVLVLPNAACLDERQMGAIRRFVEQGGGLVASLDTSLCNEFGDERTDFGLADVLGVHYRGVPNSEAPTEQLDVNFIKGLSPEYWEKRKGAWDLRIQEKSPLGSSRLRELIGNEPVTFKGPTTLIAPTPPGVIEGTLSKKGSDERNAFPGVVTNRFGKGRVVYMGAGLDAGYYLYAYPYQRALLRSAIEWAATAPPPVTVNAPMCVHSVLMRQQHEGERLILHLYNDVNTTAFHAVPDNDVPLREEVLPIHDIRVRFRNPGIKSIHLEPGNTVLTPILTPEGMEVTIPKLDIHSMVVAELGQQQ